MNKNRNRHTGHFNAFKMGIIKTGDCIQAGGREYYSKVVGMRTARDAQGNALPPVPSRTIVRTR